ncbi:Nucleolin [Tupaia chinensis]|uniref:Nucleolin n=1 Tax=Tupaia chinensis TaxID=246437 RepID=L9L243_TUPCH|nr:Nucleolin [Tupaia chinensis]
MVKLAKAGKNQGDPPKMAPLPKEVEEDSEDEEMSEDEEDDSSGEEVIIPQKKGSSKGFGFVDLNSEEDAKAAKEAMENGEIDGNKVTLDWAKPKGEGGFGGRGGGRGDFGGRGGGREAEVDLVAEAEEALEGEVASEEAEEEEETTSHKERRRSLNSFSVPLSSLFHLKERTLGFLLCYLITDGAF